MPRAFRAASFAVAALLLHGRGSPAAAQPARVTLPAPAERRIDFALDVKPILMEKCARCHFTDAGCVLLFEGGIKRGHLHGVTADGRPCRTLSDRVVIEDLHATILHALGISPTLAYTIEERPFYVTRDGKGQAIQSLFA